MIVFKKSALGVAIASVVGAMASASVYAADVNFNGANTDSPVVGVATSENKDDHDHTINSDGTETVTVTSGGTLISNSSGDAALTIDVDGANGGNNVLQTNVVISGAVDGTNNGTGTGTTTGIGIRVSDSDVNDTDTFSGNMTINTNVKGSKGVAVEKDMTGNITIGNNSTITGSVDGIGVLLDAVTGTVTNNGIILATGANGSAIKLNKGVSGGITNSSGATINSAAAAVELGATENVNFTNAGTVTGHVTATNAAGTLTVTNTGTITGNVGTSDGSVFVSSNTGTIEGNIGTSVGNVTLNNTTAGTTGGSVTGAVGTGTGNVSITNTSIINITAASGGGAGTVTLDNTNGTTNLGAGFTVDTLTNAGVGRVSFNDATNNNATITLTVVNDFTNGAGTTIEKASDSDDTANLIASGTLTNSGTINVDHVNATGAMTNSSSITTKGMTLGAASTNSGTLNFSGTLGGAGLITNSGTMNFNGNATVAYGANLVNTGTLDLGANAITVSSGHLTSGTTLKAKEGASIVTGGLDASGSAITLHVVDGGSEHMSDTGTLLAVGGNVTLNNQSSIVVTADSALLVYDVATESNNTKDDAVLISGAAVGGIPASITTNHMMFKVSDIKYNGTSVTADLSVIRAGDALVNAGSGISGGTKALANDFTGTLSAAEQIVVDALGRGSLESNMTSGAAAEAEAYLDIIRPDDSGASAQSVASFAGAAMNHIGHRTSALRGANFGDMMLSGRFWLQGMAGEGDQDAADGQLGYDTSMKGITLGVDGDWDAGTTGIAFSHGSTEIEFGAGRQQSEDVSSYVSTLYHNWQSSHFFMDTSLSYGYSNHDIKRSIGSQQLKGDFDSSQIGVQLFLGMSHVMETTTIEPKIGFRGTWVDVDGYTAKNEAGTITEKVGDVSYKKMELGLGAAIRHTFEMEGGIVEPQFSLMHFHDTANEAISHTVNFAGNDYAIKGNSPEPDSLESSLGVDFISDNGLALSVGYTHVYKHDFKSNNYTARLKYDF